MFGQVFKLVDTLPAEDLDEQKAKEFLAKEIENNLSILRAMCLYMGWQDVAQCLVAARSLLSASIASQEQIREEPSGLQ